MLISGCLRVEPTSGKKLGHSGVGCTGVPGISEKVVSGAQANGDANGDGRESEEKHGQVQWTGGNR